MYQTDEVTIYGINKKIWKLWDDTKFDKKNILYAPYVYPKELVHNKLLIMGVNPSFTEESVKLYRKYGQIQNPNEYLKWDLIHKPNMTQLMDVEYKVQKKHSYFNWCDELANKIGTPYEHIDMFFYRAKDQKECETIVFDKKSAKLNSFGQAQLEITKALIEFINPKLILVANAFAAHRLFDELNLKNTQNEKKGCYYYSFDNTLTVPIFLSSMISGGHMDEYSRLRLIWQMKSVLNNPR